jgi:hypothetical protein
MKYLETEVDMPDGYMICPFPKSWKQDHAWNWTLSMPEGTVKSKVTIMDVLTQLDTDLSVIAWKTGHAGVKGCTKYLLAVDGDRFTIEPNPNEREQTVHVKVRPEDVRLFYFMKPFNKGK